jgi:hypothetical protein
MSLVGAILKKIMTPLLSTGPKPQTTQSHDTRWNMAGALLIGAVVVPIANKYCSK